MMASENDVIPGSKVGGIGDVVRDIPQALAGQACTVTVMVPAYSAFHELPGAELCGVCTARFRGRSERIELYELYKDRDPGVRYLVLHHRQFGIGGAGQVYCDDDAHQPFATDANKFALFSAAGLSAILENQIQPVDILHLHDWHSALALALIKFDATYASLQSLPCVFSIHNLALQGVRPFAENESSLQAWFPHLHYNPADLADPRWPHCINPVAAAIRLADKVHTVSPTYASEILQPNDPQKGFHGGEGLEADLIQAQQEGRLAGIINGVHYPEGKHAELSWAQFVRHTADALLSKMTDGEPQLKCVDYLAHQRLLNALSLEKPQHLITSVGRLTDQKMALLLQPMDDGSIPLAIMLETLKGRGVFILLGSGDTALENQCQTLAARFTHFIFINQYSQTLSDLLFAQGDLFLMPSSFEPCGISQMIAMREGQPVLAHAVGGLKDTIKDGIDGFLFHGESSDRQAHALLTRLDDVLALREKKPQAYDTIMENARRQRFNWRTSAATYKSELYS